MLSVGSESQWMCKSSWRFCFTWAFASLL